MNKFIKLQNVILFGYSIIFLYAVILSIKDLPVNIPIILFCLLVVFSDIFYQIYKAFKNKRKYRKLIICIYLLEIIVLIVEFSIRTYKLTNMIIPINALINLYTDKQNVIKDD